MYEQFFGLDRSPFKITPDTSLFYDGGRRGDVLGALVYAVQRGEGIVKVVGEVGSGKTMLCRMLQQELPKSVEIIYIANPSVSPDDILYVIAHELKLAVERDTTKHEVMHLLQQHLLNRFSEDQQVVLFVEEAQGMPIETLEEIRLLSNLETDQDKLLQIILFGQPELDDNLKLTSIRQLKERITHEFNLSPLTFEEIHSYLNFRMREVGYTGPELIDLNIAKIVAKYSGGLLRRINIIADKALLSAFAESTHNIKPKHVKAAVIDSGFDRSVSGKQIDDTFIKWLLFLLLIIITAFWFVSSNNLLRDQLVLNLISDPLTISGHHKKEGQQSNNILSSTESSGTPGSVDDEIMQLSAELLVEDDTVEPEEINQSTLAVEVQIQNILGSKATASNSEAKIINKPNSKKQNKSLETEMQLAENSTNNNKIDSIKSQSIKKDQNQLLIDEENTKIVLNDADTEVNQSLLTDEDWLQWKLNNSKDWLFNRKPGGVSIQVMMRSKSAALQLARVLRSEWPLSIESTYLYEIEMKNRKIFRVFYGGFDSLSEGQSELKNLPDSVKVNLPYLHSITRMKKKLL